MTLRLGHIELFVENTLQAADFYNRVLGFETVTVQGEGDSALVWLKISGFEILLRPKKEHGADGYNSADVGIVLYTDDYAPAYRVLAQHGLELRSDNPGQRQTSFETPDGHWFQLVDPADF